jgi:hypothetical protein
MRRLALRFAALVAALAFSASAGAYGGGASHDTWQIGLSFNCNNPDFCGNELGGFWGWVEFDRWSDGSITGDAELAGCGHSVGGGGPGSAGAGHISLDATSVHLGPAGPDDPNPGGQVFYIDHNVATFTGRFGGTVVDDPDFLGDSGIPAEPGHYSFHPAPGVTFVIQVAYRPAR